MVTVSLDVSVVESQLAGGGLACPSCSGVLGPWGWARERVVGRAWAARRVRPRRSRCRSCAATHVLLPALMLLRRADGAEVIGRGLELCARGWSRRRIVRELGLPRSTVRGWLSRLAEVADTIRAHFTRWALWLDAGLSRIEPSGSPLSDAVTAIAVAARAAGSGSPWMFASAATDGQLLSNTSSPFPAPWAR
ncbi:MAG: helix-turn-helix domain-containing protein [Actinobacteria bacterium]|nr:helix-turn-helix domain-containing protein [Actinomycetota bacterium]